MTTRTLLRPAMAARKWATNLALPTRGEPSVNSASCWEIRG